MEKPILFSTEMVGAILAGRKTMTRRVVTVPWNKGKRTLPYEPYYIEKDGKLLYMDDYGDYHSMIELCPFGKPGDILWVRETWAQNNNQLSDTRSDTSFVYRADGKGCALDNGTEKPWKRSIHMPRIAARLFLRVKSVKVGQLYNIGEVDMLAEGLPYRQSTNDFPIGTVPANGKWYWGFPVKAWNGATDWVYTNNAKEAYREFWEYNNPKHPWENLWVWVIEFEVINDATA